VGARRPRAHLASGLPALGAAFDVRRAARLLRGAEEACRGAWRTARATAGHPRRLRRVPQRHARERPDRRDRCAARRGRRDASARPALRCPAAYRGASRRHPSVCSRSACARSSALLGAHPPAHAGGVGGRPEDAHPRAPAVAARLCSGAQRRAAGTRHDGPSGRPGSAPAQAAPSVAGVLGASETWRIHAAGGPHPAAIGSPTPPCLAAARRRCVALRGPVGTQRGLVRELPRPLHHHRSRGPSSRRAAGP
jgi:hypothetical protein